LGREPAAQGQLRNSVKRQLMKTPTMFCHRNNTVLAPATGTYEPDMTLQEVPLMTGTIEEVPTMPHGTNEVELDMVTLPVNNNTDSVCSRTHHAGPAENLSINRLNDNPYYGLSPQQHGTKFLILFFVRVVYFVEGPIFCFGIWAEEVDMWLLKAPYSASVSGLRK
jgi:hypothetical protein